jgi:hypothetical protein
VRELDESNWSSRPDRKVMKISLDMKPETFHQVEVHFLDELADVLDVRSEEIWITDVHAGCTMLKLEVPGNAQQRFKEVSRSGRVPSRGCYEL